MGLTGYVNVPDIKGESYFADHEDEIDFYNIQWQVRQPAVAQQGHGRAMTRAEVGEVFIYTNYSAADPYIALSCMRGTPFNEITYMIRKDSGDAHIDYLQITLTDAIISLYEVLGAPEDIEKGQQVQVKWGAAGKTIKFKYIVQEEDGSAGDEHEIEHDIAAGK
mgnify:FL=1